MGRGRGTCPPSTSFRPGHEQGAPRTWWVTLSWIIRRLCLRRGRVFLPPDKGARLRQANSFPSCRSLTSPVSPDRDCGSNRSRRRQSPGFVGGGDHLSPFFSFHGVTASRRPRVSKACDLAGGWLRSSTVGMLGRKARVLRLEGPAPGGCRPSWCCRGDDDVQVGPEPRPGERPTTSKPDFRCRRGPGG